uniref:Uncharacterized protein n=1 Tax=Chromera velia CCMP2878 TaxID=1169474 RepID=A0A0G4I0C2_9ALVE|eukprot:Cvel_34335.t1-p1 / transcript=Cvel_34335.t1 / gene=Cvel_34335 / organism=Chromera_velia_CCMP2878 / gene_product=hypothetical protein / transcript_product=hypothetical protein / location=Cvel_scaffold5858:2060-2365(-) / protein_length=102 / sequence_SO=supercontig / SO=protein_coding / is_pseudo=false
MLTDFSRKWSEKMKGSGSGNIERSNNRKNRQQRQQQSHQGQQQSDDKQQSQSSHSSGQNGGQSLSKADIDSIASMMVKMQEDKKEGDSSRVYGMPGWPEPKR